MAAMWTLLFFLATALFPSISLLYSPNVSEREKLAFMSEALDVLLSPDPRCTVLFLSDGSSSSVGIVKGEHRALRGRAVFELGADARDSNKTLKQLSRAVEKIRLLRQQCWCVSVVVLSEDSGFLASFAESALNGRLLILSTRLLLLTRLPLQQLQDLHEVLSMTNAMSAVMEDSEGSLRCSVYIHLPYTTHDTPAVRVASWTPQNGLILSTQLSLFPDKFSKFLLRPRLVVTAQRSVLTRPVMRQDPHDPRRKQLWFIGHVPNLLELVARSMNFSYVYERPPDAIWGIKQADGSWSGMVGVVSRKEADIGLGPFGISASRAEVVDFLWPVMITNSRILGGRGQPEIYPWGFLLPLTPLVWMAILATLLVMPSTVFLASFILSVKGADQQRERWTVDAFQIVRVFLQQDITSGGRPWWWEQVVLGVWMMMTLVLTRSYSGNLMSLLAVRYIPQPYQTLREVLDDTSITILWQSNSTSIEYFRYADSGIFRELGEAEKEGRIHYERVVDHGQSLDTFVRRGDHVLIEEENMLHILTTQHFSRTGHCYFYISREGFLTWMIALIAQKDSPLVPAFNKRIMQITEGGLFMKWLKDITPNSTSCRHPPTKITITTTFSASNIWGMFVAFGAGLVVGLLIFLTELFIG